MSKQYVHYGSDSFNIDKFQAIKNNEWGAVKPIGGLWASPFNTYRNWKHWCEDNDFWIDKLKTGFKFSLNDNAKVFHIYRVDQLDKLPKFHSKFKSTYYCIDFEKAEKEWDAIELDLSNEIYDDYLDSLYFKLYGWDCDSILIMNPNIINHVESV